MPIGQHLSTATSDGVCVDITGKKGLGEGFGDGNGLSDLTGYGYGTADGIGSSKGSSPLGQHYWTWELIQNDALVSYVEELPLTRESVELYVALLNSETQEEKDSVLGILELRRDQHANGAQ